MQCAEGDGIRQPCAGTAYQPGGNAFGGLHITERSSSQNRLIIAQMLSALLLSASD